MVYLCITNFCYILAMQVGLWCLLVGDLQSRLVYGSIYMNESTCCILKNKYFELKKLVGRQGAPEPRTTCNFPMYVQ